MWEEGINDNLQGEGDNDNIGISFRSEEKKEKQRNAPFSLSPPLQPFLFRSIDDKDINDTPLKVYFIRGIRLRIFLQSPLSHPLTANASSLSFPSPLLYYF